MSGKKRGPSVVRSGGGKKIKVGSSMTVQQEQHHPDGAPSSSSRVAGGTTAAAGNILKQQAKEKFLSILKDPRYAKGAPSKEVQKHFSTKQEQALLVRIINELSLESRIQMSKAPITGELFYILIEESIAAKYSGLDVQAKLVLQCIEKAADRGIWTKDVRLQTNIQQQALTKIFKQLETRQLIKPIKSITAKSKKLYMLFDLEPSKEITGGVWYSGLDFDHEFIAELRTFIMHCTKRLNHGQGVTINEILGKMKEAKVSRVDLSFGEVQQLVQTLVYDYSIEEGPTTNSRGEIQYVSARPVTTPISNFKWWDCLSPDFHFRTIKFEDGVTLSAHEPHHHSL
ncbi:RNA polymerase Rpc34 subunit [Nitzschia inconspicua]|uniref:RNA polymerase Rpc34 subunit n=1 Tax=Nitzschia inconspicua TaxID=303405 RepID=A0A9K3PFU5_9STRA|nr:RNA polymerase Rpc34 subunit [Nitzschia inconspicua]